MWLITFLAGCALANSPPNFVYYKLGQETVACFRLLNGTHQFGCQATAHGNTGVIVRITNVAELKELASCPREKYANWFGGFAAILESPLFYKNDTAEILRSTDCISAVLLYDNRTSYALTHDFPRSDDQACPNRPTNIFERSEDTCLHWNERGLHSDSQGLLFTQWSKPVMFLKNQTNVEKILQCYIMYNRIDAKRLELVYPLCAVNVHMFSAAAGNSELCMRRSTGPTITVDAPRRFCDPLQDYNVFYAIPARPLRSAQNANRAKYLIITARMDSFSFLPSISPGDISAVTSLISVVAAAKAASQKYDEIEAASNKTDHYVLFAFFHGEAFDYIGSSKMVFDVLVGRFPASQDAKKSTQKETISAEQIEGIVDIQQIGTDSSKLFVHNYKTTKLTEKILRAVKAGTKQALVSRAKSTELPPSSAYSFLRTKEFQNLSAVVISQFDKKYEYGALNSMHDRANYTLQQKKTMLYAVSNAAQAILAVIEDYVGLPLSEGNINDTFIDVLHKCFFEHDDWWTCDYFSKIMAQDQHLMDKDTYKTTYIGADGMSAIRHIIYRITVDVTGKKKVATNVTRKEECVLLNNAQTLYQYVWQTDSVAGQNICVQTTAWIDRALSPAFMNLDNFNWKTSNYSTWTESMYFFDNPVNNEIHGPVLFLVEGSWDLFYIIFAVSFLMLFFICTLRCDENTFCFDEGEVWARRGEPL